ncbi:hypothetical protein PG999_000768 [Apiospora kogelbergensis]|uniref:Uncharacterized protein n=1 Tax=Apiospora kogelbergensis TaxID=1337665 RepID=A0AAW0RCE8_9PEZI
MDVDAMSKPGCYHNADDQLQQRQKLQQQQKQAEDVGYDDGNGQSSWVAYLETERNRQFDPVDDAFMCIFRDLLRSHAVDAARDAARAIDGAFARGWLPQRSMLKHAGDEGLADFVHLVYNLIFELAPLLRHDSAQHVRLFELLVELRRLPPRSFKLNSNEYIPYVNDPDFFDVLHEETRNCYQEGPHPRRHLTADDSEDTNSAAFRQQCEAWVNFSLFKARCVEAGILHQRTNAHGLPADQIVEGLETDPLPVSQPARDCKVMVAAQYLAVAGARFHERLILVPRRVFNDNASTNVKAAAAIALHRGRARWSLWAARLEFLAQRGGLSPYVVDALEVARRRVVALEPVLFPGMAMRR